MLTAATVFCTGCANGVASNHDTQTTYQALSRTIDLNDGIRELRLSSLWDVDYTLTAPGSNACVQILIPPIFADNHEADYTNGVLALSGEGRTSCRDNTVPVAHIYAPAPHQITMEGASKCVARKPWTDLKSLTIKCGGATELYLASIATASDGPVRIELTGAAQMQCPQISSGSIETGVSGAAKFESALLDGRNVTLVASGAASLLARVKAYSLAASSGGAAMMKLGGESIQVAAACNGMATLDLSDMTYDKFKVSKSGTATVKSGRQQTNRTLSAESHEVPSP